MGFKFQKRIKILPGITINLSKRGISTSVGVKGARITMGHGKTRTTVGIPGTGISHTQVQSIKEQPTTSKPARPPEKQQQSASKGWTSTKQILLVAAVLFVVLLAIALFK